MDEFQQLERMRVAVSAKIENINDRLSSLRARDYLSSQSRRDDEEASKELRFRLNHYNCLARMLADPAAYMAAKRDAMRTKRRHRARRAEAAALATVSLR
jgi:mRNA deadenylase 3'-5' endonuclease subunit Ccr4